MKRPGFGEANLGALAGAVTGAIGGLFAVGIPSAILYHERTALMMAPMSNILSFLVCGIGGWILGGQFGPRLGVKFDNPRIEVVVGGLCGLVPVALVFFWRWHNLSSG